MICKICQECVHSAEDCIKDESEITEKWQCGRYQFNTELLDGDAGVEATESQANTFDYSEPPPIKRHRKRKERTAEQIEKRSADFKRLADKRLHNVCTAIRVLSNLGNRAIYEYTPESIDYLFGQIDAAVQKARVKFEG